MLGYFAYGTGGRFFNNSNDLEGGLKQLGIVPGISDVLGFSPQNEKMDGHFHALKVTLTGKQTAELIALSFPRNQIQDFPFAGGLYSLQPERLGVRFVIPTDA
jgi:hypothetical protein